MRQIEGGIYPGSGSAQGIRFEIAQVTLNSKFGTMTTTPIKTFWVGPEVVNGIVNTPTVSILASNSIYADINFSKFYYTNKKLAYFQFALEYDHGASAITNGPSYWGLYDVSNDSVRQFVCPANGITPGGPPIPVGYPWASPLPYFWDTLQSPESSYFDWTVTPKGSLYILSGQTLQRNPIGYAYIQKYTFDSSGNFGFYYGYLANLDILLTPDVNQNIQKVYGLGAFNKIAVDAYDNIYLSFAYPKTPYFFQYGLFNYQFSSGLWGYYGFVSSNAIATAYDSLFNQQATGGGPQPVVSLNNQVVTPFFQISKQQLYFYPIANGSNGLGPDAPLVPYDILIGNSKLPGAPSPIYFPATNLQLLNYGISIQSIKCPYTTSNVIPDISGVYTINTQLFTNTESGYGSTVQVTLRPNMTNFEIAAAYNTAISNVTFKNPNVIVTIPEDSTEIITVPAPPIWLPTSLQFRVRSYKLYFPVTIFPESVGTPTAIYDGSVYSDVSSTRVNGFVTLSDPTLASLYFPTPPVYGNSATTFDLTPPSINNAWQIMYPTTKIVLRKLQNGFTPITDTTDLTTYPSYEHTSMFFYDNYSDLSNDIFNKFGQESASRFKAYDVSSGYFFYSYIYNIQLQPFKGNSLDISSNNGYNFLAVRAYSPCENFNCLTRFYLPGRYDFGFIALQDLSNETQTVLVDLSGSKLVNPTYATVLNQFNNAFKGNFRFGSNAVPGFSGSNYTFNGFGQFLNQYIKNYNSGTSNANILAGITSNVQSNVSQYIQTYLSDILPSYVLSRERFTDPLLFSLLFKSGLSDVRRDLEYEWGLGWNLGFPKIDTPYDTIQRATSFFKILDDYIYLRLNQEFWMNRLDSSGKENLSITHESQGQTNQFAAKLLLANFGSYAQTMIQNPITFNPVLTSIDRLSFQWVDLAGVQIDNLDCEWNAAVQITEQVTQATPNSTIPRAAPLK